MSLRYIFPLGMLPSFPPESHHSLTHHFSRVKNQHFGQSYEFFQTAKCLETLVVFPGNLPNEFAADKCALLGKMTGSCKRNKYQEETGNPINGRKMEDSWKWVSICPWKWTITYAYMYIYIYILIYKYHLNYATQLLGLPLHFQKWKIIKFTIFLIANAQVCLWLHCPHVGAGMRVGQVKDKRGGEMRGDDVVWGFHSINYLFIPKACDYLQMT